MSRGGRRYRVAALAIVIACAPLAACSSSGDAVPAGASADLLLSPPRFMAEYAQRHAKPAVLTDAQAGGSVQSRAWGFVKLLDGGRSVLVSYVIGGSCTHELGFHVEQGGNAVELIRLVDNPGGDCSRTLIAGYAIVPLGRPLAGRTLLHAPVSNEAQREITWTLQPWFLGPIHPTDDPTIMLIDMTQDTFDTHSACWNEARTTTQLVAGRFEITLWVGQRPEPHTDQGTFDCTANSVAGPFYATVHLPQPYDGQPLIDPVSGSDHQPAELVHLSDAPPQYR